MARHLFDEDLADRIAEAMRARGFALLDIWELCTAYFVGSDDFGRKELIGKKLHWVVPTRLIQRLGSLERTRRTYAARVQKTQAERSSLIAPLNPFSSRHSTTSSTW